MTISRVLVLVLLAGCGTACTDDSGAPTVTATVTATATVTLQPSQPRDPVGIPGPASTFAPDYRPVELSVHTDGCGVIRNSSPEIEGLRNLAWTFRDRDGFQVLQRNALGETRYRYYLGGTYTVTVEAWDGSTSTAVSNEVTIRC